MVIKKIGKLVPSEIKRYPSDFFVLAVLLSLAVVGFTVFSYSLLIKKIMVIFAGVSYFLWGIFHHRRKKELYFSVILEYFILAVFGVLTAIFVLLRI